MKRRPRDVYPLLKVHSSGTIPHISFDENGVCNYCREYDENKSKIDINYGLKGEKFSRFVDEAIRKRAENGSKYDALVPVSGEGIVPMWHGN